MAIASATLAKEPGPERDAFLRKACGEDPELMAAVEDAISAADQDETGSVRTVLVEPVESVGSHIGPYKILQEIGEGGCGVVYMAEQEGAITRRVALKIIKLGMDSRQVIARFEAERQALARMSHPNIATVLDAGTTHSGRPYFVMELVRGVPITRYCDEAKLPARERLRLFEVVCKAIQHAHQKGIIHRDIKPSNILVSLQDGEPVPKVIDFGIAKATEGKLTDKTLFTAFEQFIGTPAYMSPEQVELSGLDIDTRSDIYSLGVLLYELLVGRPPFEPEELARAGFDGIRRRIREEDPSKPSTRLRLVGGAKANSTASLRGMTLPELIRSLEGDLDWIVMKALEKERTRRYDTASALAKDIENFLKNEPVLARPPSNFYRIQKFARRNKLTFAAAVMMVIAAAAVFVALVGGLALSTFLFLREREARQLAADAREEVALTEAEVLAFGNPELVERVVKARQSQGQLKEATDLMDRGNLTEAEPLLDAIIDSSASGGSVEAQVRQMRSDLRARQSRFEEAAADLTRLTQIDPEDHWNWFVLSPLLIQLGKEATYDSTRTAMLERFGDTQDALIAERVAKAATLRPLDKREVEIVGDLVKTFSTEANQERYADEFAQYGDAFTLCSALAQYRRGDYAAALRSVQPVLSSSYAYFIPAGYAVLSMCHQRLHQTDAAQSALNEGRRITHERLPRIENAGHLWNDVLIANLLLDEASDLLNAEPTPTQ